MICAVAPDGKFTAEAPDFQGRWVKEADRDITRDLRHRGLLFHQEQYLHDYPFCWRADEDPLIQYPRESWFIRTTQFKDEMLNNNQQINWLPEHIRDGRFGNFLEIERRLGPVARALLGHAAADLGRARRPATPRRSAATTSCSRSRACAGTEVWEAAKKANPELADHLKVHKPYIDAITYDSPVRRQARGCGACPR